MNQDNVKVGDCTYLAAAAVAAGLCLIQNATARTVAIPTAGTVPLYVGKTAATAAGEQIEVAAIEPGKEMRIRAQGAVTAGDVCEIVLSGANAGKVSTLTTGVPRFVCIVTAADEDMGLFRAIETSNRPVGQPAPVAYNATATITEADLVDGIITSTGVTGPTLLTLPTGALMTAAAPHVPIGGYTDFTVINTGTGAATDVTLQVGATFSIVGNPTVGSLTDATIIAGSGRFRAKRTAATTWILYRLA